jgi:uncharacterized protein (TIGR00369 family)
VGERLAAISRPAVSKEYSLKANSSTHTRIARESHHNCVVCGADDRLDLGLKFQAEMDGSMNVIVRDVSRFQGYPDRLHGGIISVLFDAAMTHCLFAHGVTGVTATLNIRFLQPVISDRSITVRAQVEKQKSHLWLLKGTLQQDDELKSTAEAKFWIVSQTSVLPE